MTPNYHSSASPPTPPFPLELKEDRQFLINLNHPLPSSPSSPSHSFFNPEHDQEQTKGFFRRESQGLVFFPETGGSCNDPVSERRSAAGLKLSMSCWKKEERDDDDQNQSDHEIKINGSASSSPSANKWMSSKMRLMKKMMTNNTNSSDHIQDVEQASLEADHNNTNSTIRVCSDCNTTKTPLWRSGPRGPKSLCNACGIRQRKARRAMAAAAAAAAANGTETLQLGAAAADHVASSNKKSTSSSSRSSNNNNNNNNNLPFKKRCKLFKSSSPSSSSSSRGKKKQQQQQLCSFEDFTIVLSKNISSASSQSIFPQDEKEAAILLMALSYGLVHG